MELTGWGCTASDPSPEEDSLLTLSWASVALPPPTLPLPARKRLPAMPFKLSRDGVGDVDELVDAAATACCCWGDPTNSPGLAANMVCACVERTCCQGRLFKGSCRKGNFFSSFLSHLEKSTTKTERCPEEEKKHKNMCQPDFGANFESLSPASVF